MTMMPNVIAFRPHNANQETPRLRRPSMLIRAAREGQAGWRRRRDLTRLLRLDICPAPGAALPRLRAEEAMVNEARLAGAAEYDMHRHVTLMIAILAEMRAAIEAAPQPEPQPVGLPESLRGLFSGPGTETPAHP